MSAIRDLDEELFFKILQHALSVLTRFTPAVQTRCGPSVHVHLSEPGDIIKCVNRQCLAFMRALVRSCWRKGLRQRALLMPSVCLARDAFLEHVVSTAMHCLNHESALPNNRLRFMFFTLHMGGHQLTVQWSIEGRIHDCHIVFTLGFYAGDALTGMIDDDDSRDARHGRVDVYGLWDFNVPVARRSVAQKRRLEAWTREHAFSTNVSLHWRVVRKRKDALDHVPCLLSATGHAGVNVVLHLTYTHRGEEYTRSNVHDIFEHLDDCVRDDLRYDNHINVDGHRFFNNVGEEVTLTLPTGEAVLLDVLPWVMDVLRGYRRTPMRFVKLTMIRRS